MEDEENLALDRKNLRGMSDIKRVFQGNYDQLHSEFVDEFNINDIEELVLVRKVFEFLKERA
jgi:hypothetical protein